MPNAYRSRNDEKWELWVEPEGKAPMLMQLFPNDEDGAKTTADRLNMMCGNTVYRVHLNSGNATSE